MFKIIRIQRLRKKEFQKSEIRVNIHGTIVREYNVKTLPYYTTKEKTILGV